MLAKDKDTITLTRVGWFKAATAARPALETPLYAAIGAASEWGQALCQHI